MRIGFDAKWFYSGHPSGKVFTRNILNHLLLAHAEHQYVLFFESKDSGKHFPFSCPNVKFVYGSLGNNLLSNVILLPLKVRHEKLDLLITQNFAAPNIKARQITVVFDIIFMTDPQYFTLQERLYFSFIKPLLKFADAIVTISDAAKNDLQRLGFAGNGQSVHVLHLGVDDKFLRSSEYSPEDIELFRAKHGLPEKFILYVGRLNQRKNLENLLLAIKKLSNLSIPLVLCGGKDWKMFNIDERIATLNLGHRVYQIGFIPDAELPLLYRSSTIFVYVSKNEGFGLPPLEAMACGIPTVVSNIPSLTEVCGDCTEYVNPNEFEDIARGVEKVLSSIVLQRDLSQRGYARAREFTWANAANRLASFLNISTSFPQ